MTIYDHLEQIEKMLSIIKEINRQEHMATMIVAEIEGVGFVSGQAVPWSQNSPWATQRDTEVVGAKVSGTNNSGAAYVFLRDEGGTDNWGEVASLSASDTVAGDQFGRAVSIDNDLFVVGAWTADVNSFDKAGAAYVFARNKGGTDAWGQVSKFIALNPRPSDLFGTSVSISDGISIVGALHDDIIDTDAGAAYIY